MTSTFQDVVAVASPPRRGTAARRAPASWTRRIAGGPPDVVAVAVLSVVGVLVTYARCPVTLRHPELYAEDGAFWFANAYDNGPLRPLLWAHTGYLQTFPRLVADVGLLVPLRRLPLLFVAVAVVVQVLPAGVVASRRFATVIPSFPVRLAFAAAYLLVPNSQEVNANLTNAQWHLALLAFLVVVADAGGAWWAVFDVVVVVLCALTGPFAIVLGPLAAVAYLVRRRRWTGILAALLCLGGVVQLVSLLVSPRGTFAPLGVGLGRFAEIVGGQVVGGTVIGSASSTVAHPVACVLLLAGGAAVGALALWKGPMELRLFNVFALALLVSALVSPVASVTTDQWVVLAHDAGARYWFFPTLALLADLLWLAGRTRLWRGAPAAAASAVLVLAVALGVRTSFSYVPITPRPNWAAEVASFQRLPPGRPYTFEIVPTGVAMTLVRK